MTGGRGELAQVLRAAVAAGGGGALATVVSVRGSAYRRPGARMFVAAAGGPPVGSVSASCLDAEVRQAAAEVMASGDARCLWLDTTGPDEPEWGWGLGCPGTIEVLVEPAGPALPVLTAVLEAHRRRRTVALATVVEGSPLASHLVVDEDAARTALAGGRTGVVGPGPGTRLFVEVLAPPPRLVLCGAGDDAVPLAALGQRLGWTVDVVDDRPQLLTPARFPGARLLRAPDPAGVDAATFVVVMSHHVGRDKAHLGAFLGRGAAYLGVLGPRARLDRLLGDLAADGTVPPGTDLSAIHGPVGLDLGAEGAEEIAVAVVAELMAVAAGRTGQARLRAPVEASRALS